MSNSSNKLSHWKKEIRDALLAIGIEEGEAAAESEIIVAHVSGLSTASQVTFVGDPSESWRAQALALIEQRERRIPIQYAIGYTEFMGMKFRVEPGVFIPRSDTEVLVEATIGLVLQDSLKQPYLMDIGTGSGAIAISLAKNISDAKIMAVEIADVPFRVAQENARLHQVDQRIEFVQGNWREHVPLDLDIIVCNPPYIPTHLKDTLEPEVAVHEPHVALFGTDEDGLGHYRDLARSTKSAFNKIGGGWIVCEVGDGQAKDCIAIFRKEEWTRVSVRPDLNGIDRVLVAHN